MRISQGTVGRWLARLGISRLRDLDPSEASNRKPAQKIIARYPRQMIHVDVKKAGRIPDGGGWRTHTKNSNKAVRIGYVFLHTAIDGFSRLAYTEH